MSAGSSHSRSGFSRALRWGQLAWRSLLAFTFLLALLLSSTPGRAQGPALGEVEQSDQTSSSPATRPGDAPWAPGLERVALPRPAGYNTYDGGWIHYSYHPSVLERVQPLIKEAEAFKAELTRRLGQPVLERVDVRIARTPREMRSLAPSEASVPSYASGVAYSQIGLVLLTIQPLHPNSQHDLLEVFKHELVHVALHDAVGGQPIPRWFNEGFAVHASGENRTTRLWTLWSATLAEDLIPMARLETGFPADPDTASVAYAQAADFVRFLMRNHDEHRFRAAMARIRAGQPFALGLGDAYGNDLSTLEYEWLEDVAKRYTFWPVLFSSTVVWVGVLGLLVWGWRRRKARAQLTLARWAREEAQEDRSPKQAPVEPPGRVHIVLTRPSTPDVPEMGPRLREPEVPKVEHDGRWHTLH